MAPSSVTRKEAFLAGVEIMVGVIGRAFERQGLYILHNIGEGLNHSKSGLRVIYDGNEGPIQEINLRVVPIHDIATPLMGLDKGLGTEITYLYIGEIVTFALYHRNVSCIIENLVAAEITYGGLVTMV